MPPIWSGTLAFGLVAIPVQMVSATTSHKVGFRQMHVTDQGRVRNVKTCETDGAKLSQEEIGRAYEAPDGTLIPIADEELDRLPLPTAKAIEVTGFLDLAKVPGELFGQPYFLSPTNQAAKKPYVLMREALAKAGKGAIGKFAMRGSENLAVVHAQGDVLVLQKLRWPDEIRSAAEAAPSTDVEITADEARAADALIEALGDADMQTYHDEYTKAVEALVTAKVQHTALPEAKPRAASADGTLDLMSALQAAVGQARSDRGEDADVHHMAERKAATKKAAKKTAAKKAATKAAAKKTAAKKSTRKKAG